MQSKRPLIYVIAGEPSGDLLGANLLSLLKVQGFDFAGIGGEQMKTQGLDTLFPMEELSIMGVLGILKRLPQLLSRISQTVRDIQEKKPDVVLTIDSPEFSSRVQKRLRKLPAVERPFQAHLVAPTVWAWRPGRAKKIAKYLDHLFCLYPFEPPLFEKYGLKSTFVGHPIVDEPLGDEEKFRKRHQLKPSEKVLCILPGSRRSEVRIFLPIFKKAAEKLLGEFPDLRIAIPTVRKCCPLIEKDISTWAVTPILTQGEEERQDAFAASHLALAASGTVSMQLAHAGVPMAVGYMIGIFPRSWMKLIIQTPWVCMINVLLRRPVVPELLQTDCNAEKCFQALRSLVAGDSDQKVAFREAMDMLRSSGTSPAHVILDVLNPMLTDLLYNLHHSKWPKA